MKDVKIAILIPCTWEYMFKAHVQSLLALIFDFIKRNPDVSMKIFWGNKMPISANRNLTVRGVLKDKSEHWTHLLFLDGDNTFPLRMIDRLVDLCQHRDIATGVYFKKGFPHEAVAMVRKITDDLPWDGRTYHPVVVERKRPVIGNVHAMGMGCTMIRRHVFEKLPHPWFYYEYSTGDGENTVSEDMPFFRAVTDAGFTTCVDTHIVCGHLKTEAVGITHHEIGCELRQEKSKAGK